MNGDQTTPNQPTPFTPPVTSTPPASKIPTLDQVKNNLGPLIKDVFGKFRANKKAFYLVSGVFGLIFLIIVVGIVYKMTGSGVVKVKATPMPTSQSPNPDQQNQANLSPLDKMENDLKAAKVKIDNLDVKQLPLTPPVINYKINF